MTAENGAFTVECPTGNQILHRARIVTRAAWQRLIGLMSFMHLFPVQLHAESRRVWHGDFAVDNLQRILRQARIALLPNPMGIDSSRIARRRGAAAPTWVNIASEISKWLFE